MISAKYFVGARAVDVRDVHARGGGDVAEDDLGGGRARKCRNPKSPIPNPREK